MLKISLDRSKASKSFSKGMVMPPLGDPGFHMYVADPEIFATKRTSGCMSLTGIPISFGWHGKLPIFV